MIHNCLKCEHSDNFSKPMSMTTGNHLHQIFDCNNPPDTHTNAYSGPLSKPEGLIIDLVDMRCWVDGSNDIPTTGCKNYKQCDIVNKDVM